MLQFKFALSGFLLDIGPHKRPMFLVRNDNLLNSFNARVGLPTDSMFHLLIEILFVQGFPHKHQPKRVAIDERIAHHLACIGVCIEQTADL